MSSAANTEVIEGPSGLFIAQNASVVTPDRSVPDAAFFSVNTSVFEAWNPEPGASVRLRGIPLPGGATGSAIVERFDLLQGDGEYTVNGTHPLSIAKHILLRGTLEGPSNAHIMLAVFRGMVVGYIDVPGDDAQRVVFGRVSAGSAYSFVAHDSELKHPEHPALCEVNENPAGGATQQPGVPQMSSPRSLHNASLPGALQMPGVQSPVILSTANRFNVAVDCTVGFYSMNGSNTTTASNYAIANLAAASDIYRRDLGIVLGVSYINVWTTTGPYTGTTSNNYLTQFKNYWVANRGTVSRAVALLLHANTNLGGVAWVDVLCSTANGYAFADVDDKFTFPYTGYLWNVNVIAHELGHNFGSPHTHSCTWNPPIDSCYTAENGTCFTGTVARRGTIMSYCHLTPAGIDLVFHPRCITLMQSRATAATCKTSQSVPDIDAGPDKAVCSGSPVIIGQNATSGLPPYTYSWWPSTGLSSTSVAQPSASPTTATRYHVMVTDANGFRAFDSVNVTISTPPSVDAGIDQSVCGGGQVQIGGTAMNGVLPYSYAWSPAAGLSSAFVATPVASPAVTTRYTLTVTDALGCTARDSVLVTVGQPPSVDAGSDQNVCGGTQASIGSIASGGTPPYTYQWTPSAGLSSSVVATPLASPSATTRYTVLVTDLNGCSSRDSVLVTVNASPFVNAGPDRFICQGTQARIGSQATGGVPPYTYRWSPTIGLDSTDIAMPLAFPAGTIPYTVTVTDALGCTAVDTVIVTVSTVQTANLIWTGARNRHWSTPGNWGDSCSVPVTGSNVTIPATAPYPPDSIPAITLGNLTSGHPAGLLIDQAMTVNGTLTVQQGFVHLRAPLTISASGSTAGTSVSRFFVTASTGALVHQGVGSGTKAGSVIFPVGPDSTKYTPLTLLNSGTADQFSVRTIPEVHVSGLAGPILASHAVACSWIVEEGTSGGSSVSLTAQWPSSIELPSFQRTQSFIARNENGSWLPVSLPTAPAGAGPYALTAMGLSTFSVFAVGDGGSGLPVDLVSFTAARSSAGVHLRWETASENGTAGFAIERRTDDVAQWRELGFVQAANAASTYAYDDAGASDLGAAYRLRIVDHDGSVRLSQEQHVQGAVPASALQLRAYPNPFSGVTMLVITRGSIGAEVSSDWSHVRVHVLDLLGRDVLHEPVSGSSDGTHARISLDLRGVPAGMYRCMVEDGASVRQTMIIRQ